VTEQVLAGNFGCRAFAAGYNEKPLKTAAKTRHLCVGLSPFKESSYVAAEAGTEEIAIKKRRQAFFPVEQCVLRNLPNVGGLNFDKEIEKWQDP